MVVVLDWRLRKLRAVVVTAACAAAASAPTTDATFITKPATGLPFSSTPEPVTENAQKSMFFTYLIMVCLGILLAKGIKVLIIIFMDRFKPKVVKLVKGRVSQAEAGTELLLHLMSSKEYLSLFLTVLPYPRSCLSTTQNLKFNAVKVINTKYHGCKLVVSWTTELEYKVGNNVCYTPLPRYVSVPRRWVRLVHRLLVKPKDLSIMVFSTRDMRLIALVESNKISSVQQADTSPKVVSIYPKLSEMDTVSTGVMSQYGVRSVGNTTSAAADCTTSLLSHSQKVRAMSDEGEPVITLTSPLTASVHAKLS